MYDRTIIKKIRTDLLVMGNDEDLLFTCHFMDFLKPKKILELGAGSGAWGLFLHYFGKGNVQFDFVENFDYANRNFDLDQFWPWPSNKEELELYINSIALQFNKPFNFNIFDIDAKDCVSLDLNIYDVIRWDCEIVNYPSIIKTVVTSMSNNSVLFVDDTSNNKAIHRLITMINLVNEGLVTPLWFGNNQSVWAKPNFPKPLLFSYMEKIKENFIEYIDKRVWPNSEISPKWDHCSTSSYNFKKYFK
jgi:hypothetical protein